MIYWSKHELGRGFMNEAEKTKQVAFSDRIKIRKWRLSDSTSHALSLRSYAIAMPHRASVLMWQLGEGFPSLGQILFAFEDTFGPSSKGFDSHKQSFSFPLLLEVDLGETVIHLVWNVSDYRGSLDFRFSRVIEREEDLSKKQDVIHSYTEISVEEFDYVVGYLVGWIEGYVQSRCACQQPAEPFYRIIPANLIIYGYIENEYFCNQYEDSAIYKAKVAELREKSPAKSEPPQDPKVRVADAKAWIEKAKEENVRG